jgi:hypothetical protein
MVLGCSWFGKLRAIYTGRNERFGLEEDGG